jgi:hypothetical protein
MKKASTMFLQVVIVVLGVLALFLLLVEPWREGVNSNATSISQIYFDDPFLAYAYIASIPLFLAFYGAFRVLGYVGQDKIFTPAAVKSFRHIKYCAMAIIAFVIGGEIFIILNHGEDDPAGGIAVGLFIIFASIVIATGAAMFERILQNAVDIKSENDLTV